MTGEPRVAFEQLRGLAVPVRARVTADPEGWPIIPGRLGQVECVPGCPDLAVYTTGRLMPGMPPRDSSGPTASDR